MKSQEAREWIQLLLPVLVGFAIAGTGGWATDRWLAALPVMGLGPASKFAEQKGELRGYERGFNTYNPALREPDSPDAPQ
jgi:hypothetical protein